MKPDTIYFGALRKILFSFVPMALIASVPVRFLIYGFDPILFINQGEIPSFRPKLNTILIPDYKQYLYSLNKVLY